MAGNVTVTAGVTLTIEPGVTVQGNSSTRTLTVNGTLSAVGTGGSPITFTSPSNSAPGHWDGINFGSTASASSLKFVNVRYGGNGLSASNGMIEVSGGTVMIEDSLIEQSTSGLVALAAVAQLRVRRADQGIARVRT